MRDRAAEYERMAQVLDYERRIAIPVIRQLLTMPSIPSRPHSQSWINAGMVFELADAVRESVNETPDRREQIAELATAIAAKLDDTYPQITRSQCVAQAWKELANIRRYRSNYDAALEALDRADEALRDHLALAHDKAVIDLARATTLRELRRTDEARRLLRDAIDVFEGHADKGRVAQCELLVGMIEHTAHAYDSAYASYQRAARGARIAGDARTAASSYINIGVLDAERGATSSAMDALQQALSIFRDDGNLVEMARANRGVGLALLTGGKYELAIRVLRAARGAFLNIGFAEEAGLVGLELAEAYIADDRRAAAQRLILAVIEEFRAAKLNERALASLAYLRERGDASSRELVRHVRSYLVRLRQEPALLFLPPDE